MAKQKLYFQLSDNADVCNVVMNLSGVMQWIKGDMELVIENEDQRQYTITPIWLTDKEYRNLPESE